MCTLHCTCFGAPMYVHTCALRQHNKLPTHSCWQFITTPPPWTADVLLICIVDNTCTTGGGPSARGTDIHMYISNCIHIHYTLNVYLLFRHLRMYKQTKSLHMKHLEWFKLKAQGMSINCQLPLMMCLTHGLETHCMHIRMYVSKIYVCMYVCTQDHKLVGKPSSRRSLCFYCTR